MEYGVAIFFTDYSIGPAEMGTALEERGFESLWAPEHSHIPLTRQSSYPQGGELPKKYYDVMDPFVTLAAAATATKTLKVGTGICLVVQRDPIQTAKSVASLDQVSRGRFLFGVGAGWNQDEMADHGTTDFKGRFQLMEERIRAMRAIWTESKPEFNGTSGKNILVPVTTPENEEPKLPFKNSDTAGWEPERSKCIWSPAMVMRTRMGMSWSPSCGSWSM